MMVKYKHLIYRIGWDIAYLSSRHAYVFLELEPPSFVLSVVYHHIASLVVRTELSEAPFTHVPVRVMNPFDWDLVPIPTPPTGLLVQAAESHNTGPSWTWVLRMYSSVNFTLQQWFMVLHSRILIRRIMVKYLARI